MQRIKQLTSANSMINEMVRRVRPFSTKEGRIGLGLALASEIIRMHHGQISFTSEVGEGSSFVISLPLRQ